MVSTEHQTNTNLSVYNDVFGKSTEYRVAEYNICEFKFKAFGLTEKFIFVNYNYMLTINKELEPTSS